MYCLNGESYCVNNQSMEEKKIASNDCPQVHKTKTKSRKINYKCENHHRSKVLFAIFSEPWKRIKREKSRFQHR